jgi:hypothetical protein
VSQACLSVALASAPQAQPHPHVSQTPHFEMQGPV